MSLKSVYQKLENIAELSSTLHKKAALEGAFKDKLFLKVVKYCLDPRKKFKVKQFPTEPQEYILKDHISVADIFTFLDQLNSQKGASKQDKDMLYQLASIDAPTYEVVKRICNADLRCGVGTRMVNKVRPNTVPFTPYLRCSTIKKVHNIVYPAIIQEKANGMYAEMVLHNGTIKFGTRDSKKIKQLKHLKNRVRNVPVFPTETVYMGELRVLKGYDTKGVPIIMSRQEGNGIINQCIQGTADKWDATKVFFSMWDSVPYKDYINEKCLDPYVANRLQRASNAVKMLDEEDHFQMVKSLIVNSEDEAQEYANAIIKEGGEGGVLKNLKAVWGNKTSTEQIKMKARFEGELRVVGWAHGDKGKKNEHRMGRIFVGTDDKLVYTAVGTFQGDDSIRDEDWDAHIGRIVEVEYESVSDSKSRKDTRKALYGPASFVCFRDDKDKTDTLEDLLER